MTGRPEEETLEAPGIVLRPPAAADAPRLAEILQEPAVAAWWPRWDEARVRAEITEGPDREPGWVITTQDGATVGWLQYGEEAEPDYPSVWFDLFLATEARGRRLGPKALRRVIEVFVERGHHRFVIDPSAGNERAVRAYAAVGFKPVGIMRRYERAPDGSWRDGLLMDLLAEELCPPFA